MHRRWRGPAEPWRDGIGSASATCRPLSFRGGAKRRTSAVQLHTGKSLDSGFAASRRPGTTGTAAKSRRQAFFHWLPMFSQAFFTECPSSPRAARRMQVSRRPCQRLTDERFGSANARTARTPAIERIGLVCR